MVIAILYNFLWIVCTTSSIMYYEQYSKKLKNIIGESINR